MNIRIFLLILLVSTQLFSQEASVKLSTSQKKKILILPMKDNSDKRKFPASKESGNIMFYSLYSFIGILPQIEITNKNDAFKMSFKKNDEIYDYAKNNNIEYVLYGEYEIKREKREAEIEVKFRVWSSKDSTNIISINLTSLAGVEIFDTIDEMIKTFLKDVLKIDYKVATVNFKNFDIGDEKFSLYVNGSLVEEITNSNFTYTLKVLPQVTNLIEIKRKDGTNAIENQIYLKPYASIDFSYIAMGTIKVNPLQLEERGRKYRFLVDGEEVDIIGKSKSIKAGRKHKVELKDDKNQTHLREEFYLKDGEVKEYTPKIQNPGFIHFKAYTFDKEMLTLGVDLTFGRYFWAGLGIGGTYFKNENIEFSYISPSIEAGYFFYNDRSYLLRIGTGVNFKYYYKLVDSLRSENYIPEVIYSVNIFLNTEFSYLLFRPSIYIAYDGKDPIFSYGLGLGVNF
ncbi:MAG: hypothetical protein N2258_06835 [Brevinematales bacterium]|nr:hypothetical protein [Brevinematales bacterium]